MERVTRIELALAAWKAVVLPLNYTRNGARGRTWTGMSVTSQDFKSCASTYSATRAKMVPHPRLELGTPSLKVKCSTAELVGQLAGVVRFELTHERVKVFCLTAWLHPNNGGQGRIRTAETRRWLIYSQQRLAASLPVQFK